MNKRNIVITGATHGMGKAAALKMAKKGARLLLVGRNRLLCQSVTEQIIKESGNKNIEYIVGDLSTVREVRQVALAIKEKFDRIDTLINNAGGTFPKQRTETSEGIELSFMLQFLSRYVLTNELLEQLHSAEKPRVITIAGGGAYAKDIDLEDLQNKQKYNWMKVIGKTAALNELLVLEQSKHFSKIDFINYGPGLVRTNTTMATPLAKVFWLSIGRPFSRSAQETGQDIAKLAIDYHEGGFYGPQLRRQEPKWANNHQEAGPRLWHLTEELVTKLHLQDPMPSSI